MKPLKIVNTNMDPAALSPLRQQSSCAPKACSCTTEAAPALHDEKALRGARWIEGAIDTPAGRVPVVSTAWKAADRLGQVRARVSSFRMKYAIDPGLYAVGRPGMDSDVYVSANYKLSFDVLRRALAGKDAWILVLDTGGINVWCAAGKGTFGTTELVNRIKVSRLAEMVRHRRVIAPQLGAVGVDADAVKRETGFAVRFGPVRAADIPAYVSAGYKKTDAMRRVRFTVLDRLALTPMELRPAVKPYLVFALAMLAVSGLAPEGILFRQAFSGALPLLVLGLAALFAGAVVTPVLLPVIPFRSFAVKGLVAGAALVVPIVLYSGMFEGADAALLAASYVFFPLVSSYLALQFTGASTYTGMTGVKKELRYALPVYIGGSIVSAIGLIAHNLLVRGII
ncbi:MAG TPA: mercury methylation corrinoid protein HgcA [Spirochaetota bacterium]|nr:mercury methylation corrinoid protein HgcA [Spirochaetota bacterium]